MIWTFPNNQWKISHFLPFCAQCAKCLKITLILHSWLILSYFHEQLLRQLFFYVGETCENFDIVVTLTLISCRKHYQIYYSWETVQGIVLFRNNNILSLRNENYEIGFYFMAHCVQVKDESQGSIAPLLSNSYLKKNPYIRCYTYFS